MVKPVVAVGEYVQENHGERQMDENAEITRSHGALPDMRPSGLAAGPGTAEVRHGFASGAS